MTIYSYINNQIDYMNNKKIFEKHRPGSTSLMFKIESLSYLAVKSLQDKIKPEIKNLDTITNSLRGF